MDNDDAIQNRKTVPKQLKPFVKGDPRINRKGRPKSFGAVRELAQQIAHETARVGDKDVVINGHLATITEMILRQWATSKDARLQMAFMEWSYGKPPSTIYHGGVDGGPLIPPTNTPSLEDSLRQHANLLAAIREIAGAGGPGQPSPEGDFAATNRPSSVDSPVPG